MGGLGVVDLAFGNRAALEEGTAPFQVALGIDEGDPRFFGAGLGAVQ